MRIKSLTSNKRAPYLYLITVFTLTYLGIIYWPGVGFIPRYLGWGLGLLLPFVLAPSFFSSRPFSYFVFYSIIVYLNYLGRDSLFSNTKIVLEGLVTLYIPMGMTFYAAKSRNVEWMRKVFMVAMFAIVWITIATAYFDAKSPGIVREIHTLLQNGDASLNEFKYLYAIGMSNYLLPHALPIIVPIFAVALRKKEIPNKKKLIPLFLLTGVMMLIYFSGATGPMLVSIAVLVFSLWVKPGHLKGAVISIIVFSIFALPFLFNDDLMLLVLQWIDDLLGNEGHFHGKVVAFQQSLLMDEASGDVANRKELYLLDIEAFFDNVLIGTQAKGGHSVFLGRLGSLGLVGFIPYIMLLYEQTKISIKVVPSRYHIFYYLGCFAAFLMLLTKGVASWEVYFCWFVLLPLGIVFFDRSNQQIRLKKK